MTESPTAVTNCPATLCGCRAVGGISLACRDLPMEATCPPPDAADAEANNFTLPARQRGIVTARVPPRKTVAQRPGRAWLRGSRALARFAIRMGARWSLHATGAHTTRRAAC